MRDNFINFNMLPIVHDNMMTCGFTSSISSNGYYGYQPAPPKNEESPSPAEHQEMEVQQFESLAENQQQFLRNINRKRRWDASNEFREFKKRRQNEPISFTCKPASVQPNRDINPRKPTHNMPDMPRCIMNKLPLDDNTKKKKEKSVDVTLFEDLLRETHGCSIYHWARASEL